MTIGQKNEQGLITASRCLWDESRDNFAAVSFENNSLFAVATLYGLNYEWWIFQCLKEVADRQWSRFVFEYDVQ